MKNGLNMLKEIRDYFTEARKRMPEIKDEMILSEGQGELIYYMNGNDGTVFDFFENDRICEFMMFYKSTKCGFIQVFISDQGIINGYMYNEEPRLSLMPMIELEPKKISQDVYDLAALLYTIADKRCLYDAPVNELRFDYVLTNGERGEFYKCGMKCMIRSQLSY